MATEFKQDDIRLEAIPSNQDLKAQDLALQRLTPEEESRLVEIKRKIDLRMLFIVLMYIMNREPPIPMSLMHTMTDSQYSTCISILYVGYIFAQIPSNFLLNWCGRPSLYLPLWMAAWGIVSACTGLVQSFTGAILCRFVLGFVEAPLFPGALFVLSKWYTKTELAKRVTMLWMANFISNSLNGLISAGILAGTNGKLGHAGWRWLFWIDGAMTVFVAIVCVFFVPDFPHNDRWLSVEDRALVQKRITLETGEADEDDDMPFKKVALSCILDVKVWAFVLSLFGQLVAQSFQQFFPSIVATLGYNSTITLLLTAPPWVFAGIVAYCNAYVSDVRQRRFEHLAAPYVLAIVGFIMAATTKATAPRYIAMFFMTCANAGYLLNFPWIAATFPRPPAKRAGIIAVANCLGNLGTVAGSYIFPTAWGPSYANSSAILGVSAAFGLVILALLRWYLVRLNRKMDEAAGGSHMAVEAQQALGGSEVQAEGNAVAWRYQI